MVKSKKLLPSSSNKPNQKVTDQSFSHKKKLVLSTLKKNTDQAKHLQSLLENISNLLNYSKKPLISSQICSICAFNFDSHNRVPICLPCGHTICKRCVYSSENLSFSGVCPYDRKEYYLIKDLLPTNYSILNTENLEESQSCTTHGLELIAFCQDHDLLLCGRCLFSHRNHNFFEVSPKKSENLVNEKFKNLSLTEERLKELILIWEDYFESLKLVLASVEDRPELKKISRKIRENLSSVSDCSLAGVIEKAKEGLDSVRLIKSIYKDLNVYQQLSVSFTFPDTNRPTYIEINFRI